MKKWAKICVWIGIIWLVLILITLTVFYFQIESLAGEISKANSAGVDTANIFKLAEVINLNNPLVSLIPFFLLLTRCRS